MAARGRVVVADLVVAFLAAARDRALELDRAADWLVAVRDLVAATVQTTAICRRPVDGPALAPERALVAAWQVVVHAPAVAGQACDLVALVVADGLAETSRAAVVGPQLDNSTSSLVFPALAVVAAADSTDPLRDPAEDRAAAWAAASPAG